MGEIRHGKIHLRWCDRATSPCWSRASCGLCGGQDQGGQGHASRGRAASVRRVTSRHIRTLVDRSSGRGPAWPSSRTGIIVLLNKAPDIDRMDEVIVGGEVVGAVRFSLVDGERFLPSPAGARIARAQVAPKGLGQVDPGADRIAIRTKSASTLAVGVLRMRPGHRPRGRGHRPRARGEAVSVGVTKMSAEEMLAHERGTAVKTRWIVERGAAAKPPRKAASWEDAVSASRETMNRQGGRRRRRFVADRSPENELPVAVSYSGGKDSLATLPLVLDSGHQAEAACSWTPVWSSRRRGRTSGRSRRSSGSSWSRRAQGTPSGRTSASSGRPRGTSGGAARPASSARRRGSSRGRSRRGCSRS